MLFSAICLGIRDAPTDSKLSCELDSGDPSLDAGVGLIPPIAEKIEEGIYKVDGSKTSGARPRPRLLLAILPSIPKIPKSFQERQR